MKPLLALMGVTIIAIVALMWWQGRLSGGPSSGQAHLICTRFAAEWYRLPGSATHSTASESRVSKSGDVYTVAGWSDTPLQRYRWTCQTRPSAGDRWELISIS